MSITRTGSYTAFSLSAPLLPLATLRRLDLNRGLLHLVPVRAERRTPRLLVALEHSALGIRIGVLKDLLEERVQSGIAADVGVLLRGLLLLRSERLRTELLPVLALLLTCDFGSRLGCGGEGGKGCAMAISRSFMQ